MKVQFAKEYMRYMIRNNQTVKLSEKSEREFPQTKVISLCIEGSSLSGLA